MRLPSFYIRDNNRNGTVALGSLQSKVERKRSGSSTQIDENSHIGRHLLKKRLELGMFQKGVAGIIGVTIDSVSNWENGFSEPQIQFNPAIISSWNTCLSLFPWTALRNE